MRNSVNPFQDQRSGKVALVAHCILNQNAKVAGLARFPAAVPGVAALLERYRFGLVQMPCPEMETAGLRRWWQVSDQYRCAGFRRSYDRLADLLLDQVEDYLSHSFTTILVGIDGSPSCGVDITDRDTKGIWLGCPSLDPAGQNDIFVDGPGVFIQSIRRKARSRDLPELPAIGLALDTEKAILDLTVLEAFLAKHSAASEG